MMGSQFHGAAPVMGHSSPAGQRLVLATASPATWVKKGRHKSIWARSLRSHPTPAAQTPRLIAGVPHRVRRPRHSLAQVSGLGFDEADQGFSSVWPLARQPGEDGGEEPRRSDGHVLHLLKVGAPAGSHCDMRAGRRYRLAARGSARGPILSKLSHDGACQRSNRGECVPLADVLPAQLGVSGFGRGASSVTSQRGTSCQIIRASQHLNSPHSLLMLEVKQKEIPQCGIIVPSSRSITPSAR